MACPNCGCKTTYSYSDEDIEFDFDSEMERCAACGKIFFLEEALDEEEDERI